MPASYFLNGGEIMADVTYINQGQYNKQGGNVKVIASGGSIEGETGGFFDAQTGFEFYLGDSTTNLSAAQLRTLLWNQTQFSVITNTIGVLSVVNLPSAGIIILSIATGATDTSAWLTSTTGIPGQVMEIFIRGAGHDCSCYISTSGVSIVGLHSTDVSSFSLQGSVATESMGYIKLLLTAANEWSVIHRRGQVVERGA